MAYTIILDDRAANDVRALRRYDQQRIIESINRFLTTAPSVDQPPRIIRLEQPAVSEFRLRVGEFRVYNVIEQGQYVAILRIVKKENDGISWKLW